MAGQEGAGRSAADRAAQMRAKADRLNAAAARWEQGANGERTTAAVLNPLSGDGWHVLHDVAVPHSPANIDHIVVGPPGVVVVDSKDWTGRINAGSGTLWIGRYPKRKELETLGWECSEVRLALATSLPGWKVPVVGMVSLTSAEPASPVLQAGDIIAVRSTHLVRQIASRPALFEPAQVDAIARAIDIHMGSRTGLPSAIVTPDDIHADPLPHLASPRRPAGTVLRRRGGREHKNHPSVGARRAQSARQAAPRHPTTPPLAKVIGFIILGFVALSIAGGAARSFAKLGHLTRPPVPTSQPPAPLQFTWACPGQGQGWTANLTWPPGKTPPGSWEIETSPAASGPWSIRANSAGPPEIHNIHAGQLLWVRAGPILDPTVEQGQMLAPAGC